MADDKIQKLDLHDAANRMKEQIQLAFVMNIPDEQWIGMIETELKKFTESHTTRDKYSNEKVHPAAFSVLAQEVLLKHAKEKLEEKLKSKDYLPDGKTMESIATKWLEQNGARIVTTFFEGIVQTMVTSMTHVAAQTASETFVANMQNGVGVPDANRPGYDRAGNWMP